MLMFVLEASALPILCSPDPESLICWSSSCTSFYFFSARVLFLVPDPVKGNTASAGKRSDNMDGYMQRAQQPQVLVSDAAR